MQLPGKGLFIIPPQCECIGPSRGSVFFDFVYLSILYLLCLYPDVIHLNSQLPG